MIAMRTIFGQDTDGVWHVARETFAATMNTECGRTNVRTILFFAGTREQIPVIRPLLCAACFSHRRAA